MQKLLIEDSFIGNVWLHTEDNIVQKPILMIFGNWNYVVDHAPSFLASAAKYAKNYAVHMHIINPIVQFADVIQQWHTIRRFSCSFEQYTMPNDDYIKLYTSNVRFYRIWQFLPLFNQSIMAFDIDSLINAPFTLDDNLIQCDLSLYTRLYYPEQNFKTLVSTVFFNPKPLAHEFLGYYAQNFKNYASNHKLFWYFDQVTMGQILPQMANHKNLHFVDLPKTYIDWDFLPNSIIWNGKGPRKNDNQLYNLVKKNLLSP